MFEVNTMNGSLVIAKIAGIESTAKITSLISTSINAIKSGDLDYTIDQQPYLQGFLPVIALYLYKVSGGLISPTQTNTGLLFVTKDNVEPYQNTKTRYEGSDTAPKLFDRTGPIAHE